MSSRNIGKAEIEEVLLVLRELEYITGFSIEDNKIRQFSCVKYGDIANKIGEYENKLKKINREERERKDG